MNLRLPLISFVLLSTFSLACSRGRDGASSTGEADLEDPAPRAHFVCREYNRATEEMGQRTVVLTQTDDQGLTEGEPLAFRAELFEGGSTLAKQEASGHALTEEVMFDFRSDDDSFGFQMYFDELEQSSLTLNGQHAGDFVCVEAEYACASYDRATNRVGRRTVAFVNRGKGPVLEDTPHPFTLDMFDGPDAWQASTIEGTVQTGDVHWQFTSVDEKTGFHIYLDEMNDSDLTVEGQAPSDYVCF